MAWSWIGSLWSAPWSRGFIDIRSFHGRLPIPFGSRSREEEEAFPSSQSRADRAGCSPAETHGVALCLPRHDSGEDPEEHCFGHPWVIDLVQRGSGRKRLAFEGRSGPILAPGHWSQRTRATSLPVLAQSTGDSGGLNPAACGLSLWDQASRTAPDDFRSKYDSRNRDPVH